MVKRLFILIGGIILFFILSHLLGTFYFYLFPILKEEAFFPAWYFGVIGTIVLVITGGVIFLILREAFNFIKYGK